MLSFHFLDAQKGFDESQQYVGSGSDTYEKAAIQLGAPYGDAEVAQALLDRYEWLPANGYSLAINAETESRFSRHFNFSQTFHGIPIYQCSIKANVGLDGGIFSILNNLETLSSPAPAAFALTEEEIRSHLLSQYGQVAEASEVIVSKVYFLKENELLPAFRAEYPYGNSQWEEVLDARDYRTLARRDLASYHHSFMAATDTTGLALVFNPDPLTSSGQLYGSTTNWQDNNDADNPDLNGERVQVVLQDIDYSAGFFRLQGPYANLADLEAPNTPIATSLDGNFFFTRSQSGFEDAMCYYHVDTYQRYIQSLGFTTIYASPLNVDPHGLNNQDNSHFVPAGISTRIAFGEGCVDDAEDADVIVHEYGHALSYSASPGTNSGTERQGLDEGIGDYIAASYSKNLYYQNWKNTFSWDGHNTCWDGRSASDPTPYPPNTSNLYVYGSIWASTLMEVHDMIGREQSDIVFFESLFGNGGFMTLTDAARVVLDADSIVYGQAHDAQYKAAFCSRGILSGIDCIVGRPDPSLERPIWSIFPNPSNQSATIFLQEFPPGANYRYEVSNLLGQILRSGELSPSKTALDVSTMEPGVYLLRLLDADLPVGAQKFVVQR